MPWRKGYRLKLVPEAEAPPRTQEIYREMRQALGFPQVSPVAQALAVYPVFLDLFWRAFRPITQTQDFFRIGERLRADAYTRVFNYFQVPDLANAAGAEHKPEISQLLDLLQYKNPLLLLITAAQSQAFDAPLGRTTIAGNAAEHPVFSEAPVLVDEHQASPQVRHVYEEIRRTLGYPFISYDFQALARWPDFLLAYWEAIKSIRESPLYEGSHYAVRESAFALAHELPAPVELSVGQMAEAGLSDEDIASVVQIVEMFVNSLSGLVLTTAIGHIGIEGGTLSGSKAARRKGDKERAA